MNALAMGWERTLLELKMYSREKEAVFFNFLFPILLLVMFSTIFGGQFSAADKAAGMNAGRLFLPGLIAAGVMLTSFQTMAMSVTVGAMTARSSGCAHPMPPVAYFLGKVGLVLATSVAQLIALLLVARFSTTSTAHRRRSLVDSGLGLLPRQFRGTVLGIAYSSLGTARSIGAVVIAPALVLQFISGVYFAFKDIPSWLQQVAAIFPLKWVAQGMRSVFYPDALASQGDGARVGARSHGDRPRVVGDRWPAALRQDLQLVQARHDLRQDGWMATR